MDPATWLALDSPEGFRLNCDSAEALSALLRGSGRNELSALGLLPLLAYLAKQRPWWDEAPPELRLALTSSLAQGRAEALRRGAALEMIGQTLGQAGIPCLLIKGADLAYHVFPALGLRQMLDMDLLVPPHQLEACASALRPLGFAENDSLYSRQWYMAGKCQLPPLENPGLGLALDVHGTLHPSFSPFNPPPGAPWEKVLPSRWPGLGRLRREIAVWLTVCHAWIFHPAGSGARSKGLVDLLAILANQPRESVDWHSVVELARATDTCFALARALQGLARFSGAQGMKPLTREVAALAQRRRWRELRQQAVQQARWLVPFLGRGQPWPPDAWRQFIKRPARIAGQLLRQASRRGWR
jgi:hypothetical protein